MLKRYLKYILLPLLRAVILLFIVFLVADLFGDYIVDILAKLRSNTGNILSLYIYPITGFYILPLLILTNLVLFRAEFIYYFIISIPLQYIVAHKFNVGGRLGKFFFTIPGSYIH